MTPINRILATAWVYGGPEPSIIQQKMQLSIIFKIVDRRVLLTADPVYHDDIHIVMNESLLNHFLCK